ncbi:MAG TPA: M13 family metallopeptidase [Gemmatimonadales bacterium]|nr:M13 family metallopeptidase [Gemmatimonadales bacterium]
MIRRHRAVLLAIVALASPGLARAQTAGGLDLSAMDRSVAPGDDFYRYANGTWLRTFEIPADRSGYGAFNIAADRADRQLTALVEGAAAADAPAGSDLRRIGDYYRSYVDTAAIEAAGLAPLAPALARIEAIGDRTALARHLGAALRADVDVLNRGDLHTDNLFGLWIEENFDDPTRYVPILLQGGLTLPDRAYYVDTSASMAAIRDKYRAHVAAMLTLAKVADAQAKADAVLQLETRIAQAHWIREDSWEPGKGNNHWARAELATKAPGLDWDAYLKAAGLDGAPEFVAWQASAITGLAALVASEPLDAWKALLTYHAIERRAAVLPQAFDKASFAFFGTTLSGAPMQRARAKRAVAATSNALGFAVGRLYVAKYFPASEKARAEKMVADILTAFDTRIDGLDWMAPATKREAKAKLKTIRVSVGYPDKWPSYAGLEIVPGDAYGNAERVELFEYREALAKLGQPVDRDEWVMVPQLVNAVNLPARNAMNFPAAILQPPFFDPTRPTPMDYGAIGAVIGHEISHSFDNLGAQFDAQGRLRNWWTPEDLAHFNAAADRLVQQYDAYKPFPDLAVNGRLTLAENIADLAGLTAAYDAYRLSFGGKQAPTVGGLTGDQQFFLSFAQAWRGKLRDAALRGRILTDGHAPGQYRALTVRNIDAWYRAFGVKPSQALHLAPQDRVQMW